MAIFYQAYAKETKVHPNTDNEMICDCAFVDDNYEQLNQWTRNRYWMIETMRSIQMNHSNNPYRKKRIGKQPLPISNYSMLEGVTKPFNLTMKMHVALREREISNRLFSFDVKRMVNYLNIFEEAMGVADTYVTLWIDQMQNIFFLHSDPIWCKNPFLLDLYMMLINMGNTSLVGQTVYGVLSDISYGLKKDNPNMGLLSFYKFQVCEMIYSAEKYFANKSFWIQPYGPFTYTQVYNLDSLLNGRLKANMSKDKGLFDEINRAVAGINSSVAKISAFK